MFTLTISGTAFRTNSLSFVYFNTSTSPLHLIQPEQGLNTTSNTVVITGRDFPEVAGYEVWVGSDQYKGVCCHANSSSLMCNLPTYPVPSSQVVMITINGQKSGILPYLSRPLTFTFYSTAPTLMSVMFDPSYAELWVQFDREVEVGGEHDFNTTTPPSCALLFDPPTLSILSSTSKCKWKNSRQRQVTILLSQESSVAPGYQIGINSGILRTRSVEYSRLSKVEAVTIATNTEGPPLYPVAIITGTCHIRLYLIVCF